VPGRVLLVSHARALLDAVAERTVAIEDPLLRSYDGGWADLVRTRSETTAACAVEAAVLGTAEASKTKPRRERRGPTELERVETRIGELERHIASLENDL